MDKTMDGVKTSLKPKTAYIFTFFAVLGPGIISACADNDAPGIGTYSIVGARFGYSLLWMLILITMSLGVTQEMGARMGIVTRKGLGALIREHFDIRLTTFAIIAMLIANLGTTIAEFAGIASSLEIFGISKYVSVPVMAILISLLVIRWSYKRVEKIFLLSAIVYICYVISGYLAHPNWDLAAKNIFMPSFQMNAGYILAFIATAGTTITPWGQFFIQSYIVDKGLSLDKINYEKTEVYLGAFFTDFIAFFIIVACAATLWVHKQPINGAADAARALAPLAGRFASTLFAFGLWNASMLGAAILPLTSAYATCEAFGWEAGVDRSLSEAGEFYGIYAFLIIFGALFVLIPGLPLFNVLFICSALNGILLPIILIFVLILINDKTIMGRYTNSKIFNLIAWFTTIVLIVLTLLLLITSLLQVVA
jgi:Mn2+/Fe2+ NRAMP family transporter